MISMLKYLGANIVMEIIILSLNISSIKIKSFYVSITDLSGNSLNH